MLMSFINKLIAINARCTKMFTAVLAAGILTSCINDSKPCDSGYPDNMPAYLTVSLNAGNAGTRIPGVTKAPLTEADMESGIGSESLIHSYRIWIFASRESGDGAQPIGYAEGTGLSDTGNRIVSVKLRTGRMNGVDIYALVNAEDCPALMTGDGSVMTRGQLKSGTTGGFGIGPDMKPAAMTVPSTGLPMSRVLTNVPLQNYVSENIDLNNPIEVPLLRAVSKFQFYIAKTEGDTDIDALSILNVEFGKAWTGSAGISGNFIPKEAMAFTGPVDYANVNNLDYLYTSSAFLPYEVQYYPQTVRYTGSSNILFNAADISPVKDPTAFRRGLDETAREYAERLRNAGLKSVTSYFLESGQALRGVINYRFSSGIPTKVTFDIRPEEFLRNHEYIIYAYVLNGLVEVETTLKYQVIDWKSKDDVNIDFN